MAGRRRKKQHNHKDRKPTKVKAVKRRLKERDQQDKSYQCNYGDF